VQTNGSVTARTVITTRPPKLIYQFRHKGSKHVHASPALGQCWLTSAVMYMTAPSRTASAGPAEEWKTGQLWPTVDGPLLASPHVAIIC